MARHTFDATPPSTADRRDMPLHSHPLCMSPSPWVNAPPTPQDSQASACQSPSTSLTLRPAAPASPTQVFFEDEEDDNVLIHSNDSAAKTASLRRSQPTLITIGPKAGREHRMQQWLSEIPAPVTPQERYIQGLNSAADHPLHPRPLRAIPSRQERFLSSTDITEDDDGLSIECKKLAIDGPDKENAVLRSRLPAIGTNGMAAPGSKKRQVPEDTFEEGAVPRKRTRLFDPVRRISQRLSSSLILGASSDDDRRDSLCEDLSPEDMAKQSEQMYKFGRLNKTPSNSFRMPLSKRNYGTLRSQGSNTLRRMMSAKMAPPLAPPEREGSIEYWTEGRPDMIVNVAFIGDARVGKTALIKRLVHGTFPQTYAPSNIQEQTIRLTVDGIRVQLNLSEGGSGRDHREPSVLALRWFSVVVLCFDIGHQSTLQNLQKYRNDIAIYEENSVVVLAGLKKDARHRLPPLQLTFVQDPVQVDMETGRDVARKLRCANYLECSSLSSCEGVDDLFDYIVQSGVELQKERNKTMARFRFERSVDKGMTKIAEGVRSLFTFTGSL